MAASSNDEVLRSTVDSLFKGMDGFLSTKTVVGDAIRVGDTILVPLIDVSFGVGAGAFAGDKANGGGGGLGGKMVPSGVLVIHNGNTRLVNLSSHSGIDKILDMIPEFVDRFRDRTKSKDDAEEEKKARKEAGKVVEETIVEAASVDADPKEPEEKGI